ncbi:DegV family protein with EDD domain [Bacillus pakistanensis]|uniref:DegV family protein with EDD domain n=1 Tax=Rossellomorea pakistanensis TaxID=992288 RepID=A0ABS2ND54_9BACI|nr:DegV family protein [Bacillus pakistanensis]MBM7585787.1 DegV family protein with EDD domain [Bacillus pakistanensis]
MKTAIVTDSTAYIPKELRDQLNIHMIPLDVIIGGKSYREEVDISANDFYELVKKEDKLPSTSQPALGSFVDLYESLSKDYDEVISIHLSSGISGTFQGAHQAQGMVEGIEIHPFDSEISCMVQGYYAVEAARLAKQNLAAKEIVAKLDELKQSVNAYFMVDDLSHLQRGGRLTSAQAIIGSLLQVKPLLHFEDKVIVPFEKIRTRKKALKRIVAIFEQEVNKGEPLQAVIIHANREKEAHEWKEELQETYPDVDFTVSYFGPVIGTHLGEGAMGFGWSRKMG